MRINQNFDCFFADSFPIFFFSLLLLSFSSPFLFSLSSTLYPLSIYWKTFWPQPFKKPGNGTLIDRPGEDGIPSILHQKNWTRFFWYSSARIWSIFKMDARMDGPVLLCYSVAAYQNNLVSSGNDDVTSGSMSSQTISIDVTTHHTWYSSTTLERKKSLSLVTTTFPRLRSSELNITRKGRTTGTF